jgi:hypothetical protein
VGLKFSGSWFGIPHGQPSTGVSEQSPGLATGNPQPESHQQLQFGKTDQSGISFRWQQPSGDKISLTIGAHISYP